MNRKRHAAPYPGIASADSVKNGFSLIELMITVAIIGILAAFAYPSYTQYVVRANRASAQGFMMAVANKQEQYILDARQYATAAVLADVGTALNIAVPSDVSKYYGMTITHVAGNPRTYLIEATPVTGTVQAADGNLRLNNAGLKEPAGKW